MISFGHEEKDRGLGLEQEERRGGSSTRKSLKESMKKTEGGFLAGKA